MRINSVNGTNQRPGQAGPMQKEDAVSKSIQKQIANKQKELQNLSSNQDMDMEAKSKKRQEIMQEISDLNNQLRQHQIEQRREAANAGKNQEKGSSMDDFIGGSRKKSGAKGTSMSQAGMKAMISADAALNQAQAQGSAANEMENRAAILKTEIKLDGGRGADVSHKKEELAELEEKARNAAEASAETLGNANEEIKNAQEADSDTEQTDEEKKAGDRRKTSKDQKHQKTEKESKTDQIQEPGSGSQTERNQKPEDGPRHSSVDIYL